MTLTKLLVIYTCGVIAFTGTIAAVCGVLEPLIAAVLAAAMFWPAFAVIRCIEGAPNR